MSPEAVEIPEIDADDAHDEVEAGAFLLDVRELDEWEAGHAPGSVHIPMRDVPARADELPRDRRIVAICRSGSRSRAVTEALVNAGYDAANTIGGLKSWEAHGFDVVTDAGAFGVVL
ncbi:MAG: rhodanese-like domain-containing protein [Acidimicrobiia bacterium]